MERTGLESFALDYLANSIWQVPLLAAGAWLVVRAVRPGPRVRHAVWLAALMLAVAMPLHQVRPAPVVTAPVAILPPFTTAEPQPFSDATIAAPAANPNQSAPALWKSTASSPDAALEEVLLPTLASGEAPHPRTSPHALAWLHLREVQLSPAATRALLGLYLLAFAFALGRLLWSWRAARRMVAEAEPALLTASEIEILDSCCEHFNVPIPRVCMSTRASSPVVIGVFNPVLLMPTRFAPHGDSSFTNILPHELEAVWWHELAHVRRRDYLANLACRVLALPVAYHPAVWAIGRRVRQTREIVCDAMAAEAMHSPVGYARCLVGLAQRMSVAPAIPLQGTGMFDGGVLEERVMELIQKKATVSVRMRGLRLAGGMAMTLAVLTAVSAFHVTPTEAQAAPPAMFTELASPSDAPPSSASAPIPNTIAPQAGAEMPAQAIPAPAATAPEAPGQEDASRPSVYARVPVAGTYVDAMAIGPRRPVSIAYADSNGTGILVELLTKTSGVDFVPYVKGVAEDIHTKLLGTLPPEVADAGAGITSVVVAIRPDGSIDTAAPPSAFTMGSVGQPAIAPFVSWARQTVTNIARYPVLPAAFHDGGIQIRFTLFDKITPSGYEGMFLQPQDPAAPLVDGRAMPLTHDEVMRILDRNEAFYSLSGDRRMQYASALGEYSELPIERRRLVAQAFRDLRLQPEKQQQAALSSARFRTQFSAEELTALTHLLAAEPMLQRNPTGVPSANLVRTAAPAPAPAPRPAAQASPAPEPEHRVQSPFDPAYPVTMGVHAGAEILSDPMAVDFSPYMQRLKANVQRTWEALIPAEARPPLSKRGLVGIVVSILPDGTLGSVKLETKSGDVALDKAGWDAITAEHTFPPLPAGFRGPKLELRLAFAYNLPVPDLQQGRISFPVVPDAARKSGAVVTRPVLIYAVEPEYTQEARKDHISGNVQVGLRVDEDGNPTHVQVVPGRAVGYGLDEKAVEAVKQYKFRPALVDGKPVEVAINVEVNFQVF